MTIAYQVVNTTIKGLTRIFCRVDDEQLALIPNTGPLILVGNHVNFLDVPISRLIENSYRWYFSLGLLLNLFPSHLNILEVS